MGEIRLTDSRRARVCRVVAVFALALWPAFSVCETYVAWPTNQKEYERVFGYEASTGELQELAALRGKHAPNAVGLRSLGDLNRALSEDGPLAVLIGHNDRGVFRFPSGEQVALKEMEERVNGSGKIGVFLTCGGSCYVDSPATRWKTTFNDALVLAGLIGRSIGSQDTEQLVVPMSPGRPGGLSGLTPQQCADLFRGVSEGSRAAARTIRNEVAKTVFRAELRKAVSATAKVVGGVTSGAAVWVYLDYE